MPNHRLILCACFVFTHVEITVESSTIVPPQLNYHMKEYQKYLKFKYESLELISPLEMLDCFSTEYINLTLVGKEDDDDFMFQRNERCESITLAEALDVEDCKKKAVLILGGPGMGKSTLAINICKQWAKGDLLQDYDAVILLTLRDKEIQGAENIKDLLLILDDELRESVYKEIVKSNGEKICFILEGYDELPHCLQRSSVFAKLTEQLLKCTVVYTSRPEAYLPYSAFKVIKINGFNKESIDRYISKAFEKLKNGEEMACKLKSQIHDNPVVRSILHIPINVAIVCLIFSQFSMLPRTLTELYTLLCQRLILRHINTRTPNIEQVEKLESLDQLPTGISEQFSQLCYIAYKAMEGEMVIFTSQDLAKIGVDDGKLTGMGLLLIAPTISVAGREKSHNFLHLTLQEFCAAWYVSRCSSEGQIELMSTFHNQTHFKMVWRFYAGITKLWNKEIFAYVLPCKLVKSPFSDWKVSELACIAYEAGSNELCQIVGDYYKDGRGVIDLDKLEPHAINYVLTQYRGLLQLSRDGLKVLIDWSLQHNKDVLHHSLEDIVVKHCNSIYELHIQESRYANLMTQILSNSNTLSVLHIDGNNMHSCKIYYEDNVLKLSHFGLNPTAIDTIGEILSDNKSIRCVDLSYNRIGDDGVEKLVHHLISNSTLCHINLCCNEITEVGANHLRKLITKDHSSLTSIELSKNPLKDKGVDLILQSLPKGIEHIGLCDVQMTHLACQSLGDALHKVKSISFDQLFDFTVTSATSNQEMYVADQYLEVINNYMKLIYSDYSKAIAASLLSTTVLEHLEIRLTCIDSTIQKLFNVLGQNKSIKMLNLNYDRIHSEAISDNHNWIGELSLYIRHNNSLLKLIISGMIDMPYSTLIDQLADSLNVNTSIKSLIYELEIEAAGFSMDLGDAYEFINKMKENNTLEELTLNKVVYMEDKEFSEIENCVWQINKARDIKNVVSLKVHVTNV